jgi:hypothetical protein
MKKDTKKPQVRTPSDTQSGDAQRVTTQSAQKSPRIKSGITAGYKGDQHNETALEVTKGPRIKSGIKAGIKWTNHNETLLAAHEHLNAARRRPHLAL